MPILGGNNFYGARSAAIDAVKQWRYTPTLLNGVPVAVLMTITINFRLND